MPTDQAVMMLKGSTKIVTGHFHERIQRTLGGGGQGQLYAFLNVVYTIIVMEIRK